MKEEDGVGRIGRRHPLFLAPYPCDALHHAAEPPRIGAAAQAWGEAYSIIPDG
jgi:hypothetical protein